MFFCLFTQENQVSVEVTIDPRVHRRLIGTKGRTIRKFMETYKVDIRFPSLNTADPVVISGLDENVEEAKDQLLLLEEEYVSGITQFVLVWTQLTTSTVFFKLIDNELREKKGNHRL